MAMPSPPTRLVKLTRQNPLFRSLIAATFLFVVLVFYLALTNFAFERSTHAQDNTLPVVSMMSLSPSPVKETTRLTIIVRIDPPIPAGSNTVIKGGVRVFDSCNGPRVDEYIATAFRAGEDTDEVRHLVPDDGVLTTDRTIRVDIHPGWDDHQTGTPSEMRVVVFDNGDLNPEPQGYCGEVVAGTPPATPTTPTAATPHRHRRHRRRRRRHRRHRPLGRRQRRRLPPRPHRRRHLPPRPHRRLPLLPRQRPSPPLRPRQRRGLPLRPRQRRGPPLRPRQRRGPPLRPRQRRSLPLRPRQRPSPPPRPRRRPSPLLRPRRRQPLCLPLRRRPSLLLRRLRHPSQLLFPRQRRLLRLSARQLLPSQRQAGPASPSSATLCRASATLWPASLTLHGNATP